MSSSLSVIITSVIRHCTRAVQLFTHKKTSEPKEVGDPIVDLEEFLISRA